jgi:hypothetical protein
MRKMEFIKWIQQIHDRLKRTFVLRKPKLYQSCGAEEEYGV